MTESSSLKAPATTTDINTILKITPRISSKLHDENDYPAWVVEATRQLRRQKLLGVVDGTDPAPTPITAEYQDKSDKALDYLMDSVEAEPSIKIRACPTAADAWKILKDTYEGQTRTHMTALFSNLVNLRFDDRKAHTLLDHISQFEGHWLKLAQAAATGSTTPGSMAADIKTFSQSDAWKASLLLATLPRIQPYINIVQNITSTEDKPTYANVIIRLKEISIRPKGAGVKSESGSEPQAAFVSTLRVRCQYCKSKGWPGTSHDEKDCRTKRRDQSKQQAHTTEQDE